MERGRGDVMKHKRKNTPKQPSGGVTRSIFAGWYSTITARAEQQKLAKATQTDISSKSQRVLINQKVITVLIQKALQEHYM